MEDPNLKTGIPTIEKQSEINRNLFDENGKPKAGFNAHPENINSKGRPPKGWAWSEILEDIGERVAPGTEGHPNTKPFKQLVGERLWVECVNGNVVAIRELFNRMEGMPKQKVDFGGKVDTGVEDLAMIMRELIDSPDEEQDDQSKENQGNPTPDKNSI